MGQHIKYCTECANYTLKDKCPSCSGTTINPKPGRFSLEDRYGRYRRLMKSQLKES
ncbi:MAG: RNA-protein complex protein Nop10 [Methanosarcinales archaeon]|nr:RNA-protein complex protein Nop10 [Methanosarcinales archaeon]MCD4797429.1 RNA-protein complex protein Nop10 [Methanosarcinales archaeon]MCD4841244.1 RNA-protein complex protein Nop10 [Methanosarcinales archaeon]MCD4841378.1 RNA-protein complex protein Nop10 [Methanosarcinales archaeon]